MCPRFRTKRLKDVTARRVESAVVLHVQELGWAAQRGRDLANEWQLIRRLMEDEGMHVEGVVRQIEDRREQVRNPD